MNGQTISLGQISRTIDLDEARRQGFREAVKEMVKEKIKNQQKLNALLNKSQSIPLFQLATFFPLKFFPVHIVIDNDRVNITYRDFFSSGQIISLTTDILQEVAIESGPIFSTLKLMTNKPMEPIVTVKYLKKSEAIKARRLIQGLITASKNRVDLRDIDSNELAAKLEGLGQTQEAERLVE